MAFKTFTCSICNATVTKPQSYALPNGTRACRSHQESQDAHADSMNALQRERDAMAQKKNKFRSHNERRGFKPHCMCCKKPAADKSSLASIRLECMALAKAHNEPEVSLDPESFVNRLYTLAVLDMFGEVVAVERYDASNLADWQIKQLVGDGDSAMVVKMVKAVALCDKCANEFSFSKDRPSLKAIVAMSPIAEQFINERANFYKSNM